MLRRVTSLTYKAPVGARIQLVAESQDNEDFHGARFEFDLQVLDPETVLDRPGCTFTFEDTARLQAFVTFQDGAPGTARYDLFEVENGVKRSLEKFVRKSQSAPQMAFTIEPEEEAVAAAAAAPRAEPEAARGRGMKGVAKRARKAPARKTAAKAVKKKTATAKKSAGAKAKTAKAKKRKTAKKTVRRRAASPNRTTARKRTR